MTNARNKKFRPVLTIPDLETIISALAASPEHSTHVPGLLPYLRMFTQKCALELNSPAYQTTHKQTIEESLGMASPPAPTKNAKLQAMFDQWLKYPMSFTPAELEQIDKFRYENGYMFPWQMEEYEAKIASQIEKFEQSLNDSI